MLVAEELRVPLGHVRLVMGDTDVCPYDLGTFGSRSMADAGMCLRAIGSAARRALIGEAARQWDVTTEGLTARDCRIVQSDGTSVAYLELVRGIRRIENATADEPIARADKRRIVGTPTTKVTGLDVVLGSHRYVIDVTLPDMLVGLVLRPPSFGAKLRSVDVAAARAVPNVVVVVEDDFVTSPHPVWRLPEPLSEPSMRIGRSRPSPRKTTSSSTSGAIRPSRRAGRPRRPTSTTERRRGTSTERSKVARSASKRPTRRRISPMSPSRRAMRSPNGTTVG
jgi:isoquinoline 1-oxidoreductase